MARATIAILGQSDGQGGEHDERRQSHGALDDELRAGPHALNVRVQAGDPGVPQRADAAPRSKRQLAHQTVAGFLDEALLYIAQQSVAPVEQRRSRQHQSDKYGQQNRQVLGWVVGAERPQSADRRRLENSAAAHGRHDAENRDQQRQAGAFQQAADADKAGRPPSAPASEVRKRPCEAARGAEQGLKIGDGRLLGHRTLKRCGRCR
jgi:hypothetical protein